jgi:hypothetical protein
MPQVTLPEADGRGEGPGVLCGLDARCSFVKLRDQVPELSTFIPDTVSHHHHHPPTPSSTPMYIGCLHFT